MAKTARQRRIRSQNQNSLNSNVKTMTFWYAIG